MAVLVVAVVPALLLRVPLISAYFGFYSIVVAFYSVGIYIFSSTMPHRYALPGTGLLSLGSLGGMVLIAVGARCSHAIRGARGRRQSRDDRSASLIEVTARACVVDVYRHIAFPSQIAREGRSGHRGLKDQCLHQSNRDPVAWRACALALPRRRSSSTQLASWSRRHASSLAGRPTPSRTS
jgi:hypothetical protein